MSTTGDQFSFLPWVKNTLTRKAQRGTSPLRPAVMVQLGLDVEGGTALDVDRLVSVYGPGDVVGLQPEAVLKTTPPAGEQQYPALQLASIEFGEEDLPWRYSPDAIAASGNASAQAAPWCFLLVLKPTEFTRRPQGSAPLPSIDVTNPTAVFPEAGTRWAWAHVQTTAAVGTATGMSAGDVSAFLDAELPSNPDLAFSRVFSPRRLEADTAYHAFLVPAYEAGRLTGLGVPLPANLPSSFLTLCAWAAAPSGYTRPTDTAQAFPVYYQWEFRTGQAEGFEELASRLRPQVLVDFGTQPLALTTPLSSAAASTAPGRQYVLDLPGVMQEPGAPVMQVPTPLATDFYTTLRPATSSGRPLVAPPVYGRAYASVGDLVAPSTASAAQQQHWLQQVNLHPGYRSLAAVGHQVIQDNQEEYMQRAWEQVRDIIVANQNLRGMQSGLETTDSMRSQHLPLAGSGSGSALRTSSTTDKQTRATADRKASAGTTEQQDFGGFSTETRTATTDPSGGGMENYGLHLTGLAFTRLRDPATGLTLQETIRQSNVPLAAFTPTFRRLLKPFGRYQTSLAGRPQRPTLPPDTSPTENLLETDRTLKQRDALLSLLADGLITAAPPKYKNLLGYQFDDDTLQTLLEFGTDGEFALWIYVKEGEKDSYYPIYKGDERFAQFLLAFNSFSGVRFEPPKELEKPTLKLDELKQVVIEGTQPGPVFLARANRAVRLLPHYGSYLPRTEVALGDGFAARTAVNSGTAARREAPVLRAVQPIMAYPVFKDAMGPVLQQRHPDLFLPNAGRFPANAVTLLEYNRAFIESYMLGLNHAFGSELLWRDYPTDLRGSYFRQFWDVSEYLHLNPPDPATPEALAEQEERCRDIAPVHQWTQPLGRNYPNTAPAPALLLAVRGDLLKRYPTTVVCAARATLDGNNRLVPDLTQVVYPAHRTSLGEDILLFSFTLTAAQVKGNANAQSPDHGYFFVFHERPGEPQFGLDMSRTGSLVSWDDLTWSDLNTSPGGNIPLQQLTGVSVTTPPAGSFSQISSSAHFAYAVFQQPFLVAMHARSMMR